MSILTAADLAAMAAQVAIIREDNEVEITIRRDSGADPAVQSVRIERRNAISVDRIEAHSEETVTDIVVIGSITLDIEKEDRFNWGGDLYRVKFVRPNRQIATQAEAEIAQ